MLFLIVLSFIYLSVTLGISQIADLEKSFHFAVACVPVRKIEITHIHLPKSIVLQYPMLSIYYFICVQFYI